LLNFVPRGITYSSALAFAANERGLRRLQKIHMGKMIQGLLRKVFTVAVAVFEIHFYMQLNPVTVQNTPPEAAPDSSKFNDEDSDACTMGEGISMQRNISAYESKFDRESTLVMTMASSAQLELLRVWLAARRRQQLVVLAFDKETVKECCELGINYLFDDSFQLGAGEDIQFKSAEFLKLGLAKFSTLKGIVEAGYSVLFSEIDVYEVRDPEQCKLTTSSRDQKQECIYADNFDLEIHPNILPGKLAMPGSELNIGFFYLRSSVASISLLDEVCQCLRKNCGWDQSVLTSIAWKMQCCFVDDNTVMAQESTCEAAECLRIRVLSVYYFPTGGNGGGRRRSSRQFGIVPPEYYASTKTCPVIVHCTGRTGLQSKLDCARNVQLLYGNCTEETTVEA